MKVQNDIQYSNRTVKKFKELTYCQFSDQKLCHLSGNHSVLLELFVKGSDLSAKEKCSVVVSSYHIASESNQMPL